jgi:peptidoglycan/LPS O-acetylase OafA/YrhL
MKSTSGAYYKGLDHVRALAAILVYCWHSLHLYIVPQYYPKLFVLSLFEEGHTGVALFMTLSGYLFAKLTDGSEIDTKNFLWNRLCRLAPLFAVLYLFYALREGYTLDAMIKGFLLPRNWPGASWSLAIELQFYLCFPILIHLQRRYGNVTLVYIALAFLLSRELIWLITGSVQDLAYWSILGRADQLLMGMLFYQVSKTPFLRNRRGWLFLGVATAFLALFHWININGGAFAAFPNPSPSQLWVWLPLVEGLTYGCLIMCYDTMAWTFTGRFSDALARLGELSYSIYLIHSALLLGLLYTYMPPGGVPLYAVVAACAGFFVVVVGLAKLSYTYIEQPFFRFRLPYLVAAERQTAPLAAPSVVIGASHAGS